MRAVVFAGGSSRNYGTGGDDDAASFLFGLHGLHGESVGGRRLILSPRPLITRAAPRMTARALPVRCHLERKDDSDDDLMEAWAVANCPGAGEGRLFVQTEEVEISLASCVASFLPLVAALVASDDFLGCGAVVGGTPVLAACLPLSVPFAVPQVSPATWVSSKRARAMHRCATLSVYLQGLCGLRRILVGDNSQGIFELVEFAFGSYALHPDNVHFMPSYVLAVSINGAVELFHLLLKFHAHPISDLPLRELVSPLVSLMTGTTAGAFCKEVRMLSMGYPGGSSDSYWVNLLGGECSVLNQLSSLLGLGRGRYNLFSGSGTRLGAGVH